MLVEERENDNNLTGEKSVELQEFNKEALNDDEFDMSVQIINRQASILRQIAQDNDHEFLSYMLEILVLETESMLEKGKAD